MILFNFKKNYFLEQKSKLYKSLKINSLRVTSSFEFFIEDEKNNLHSFNNRPAAFLYSVKDNMVVYRKWYNHGMKA